MVELRKRKAPPAPAPAPAPPAKKKTTTASKSKAAKAAPTKAVSKTKSAATKTKTKTKSAAAAEPATAAAASEAPPASANGTDPESASPPAVGTTLPPSTLSRSILLHDGTPTTLGTLLEASQAGIVLFTYPRASTPGCTTQATLFRTHHGTLTHPRHGLALYGLSADPPAANAAFRRRHALPYALLSDPTSALLRALGAVKRPKGTRRGVFVVGKEGMVRLVVFGGPRETVETVGGLVGGWEAEGGKEEQGQEEEGGKGEV